MIIIKKIKFFGIYFSKTEIGLSELMKRKTTTVLRGIRSIIVFVLDLS